MDESSEVAQLVRAFQSWIIKRTEALDVAYDSVRAKRGEDIERWRTSNRNEYDLLVSLREDLDELVEDWKNSASQSPGT